MILTIRFIMVVVYYCKKYHKQYQNLQTHLGELTISQYKFFAFWLRRRYLWNHKILPSNYALSWLFSALFIKTNEYCGPNHCSKDRFWFLSKSKIMPQYSPNSFLFSNMKYVSFCICLAMKEKEKTFITRNVYHGLQLSAQANVTPCNLRERKFWPFSAKMLGCCHLPLDLN